jgi:hypothetical protein
MLLFSLVLFLQSCASSVPWLAARAEVPHGEYREDFAAFAPPVRLDST